MIEQLGSLEFIAALSSKFDFLIQGINAYFAGENNLKFISFTLILFALVLFLFLVIIIYVRNIIFFIKSNNPGKNLEKNIAETMLHLAEKKYKESKNKDEFNYLNIKANYIQTPPIF